MSQNREPRKQKPQTLGEEKFEDPPMMVSLLYPKEDQILFYSSSWQGEKDRKHHEKTEEILGRCLQGKKHTFDCKCGEFGAMDEFFKAHPEKTTDDLKGAGTLAYGMRRQQWRHGQREPSIQPACASEDGKKGAQTF